MVFQALAIAATIFVEAEGFKDLGGWSLDTQHMEMMGSPYLLAHGLGTPVADAQTEISVAEAGAYSLWVRTRNWTAPWSSAAAGRFKVAVNGRILETVFGEGSGEWRWVKAADKVQLPAGVSKLAIRDLTGFDGRIDALCLKSDDGEPVRPEVSVATTERYDLVVCGGGIAGICAAVSAARQGLTVALVQDRPVLGGNNSSEVRVWLGGHIHIGQYPHLGNIVGEIGPAGGGNARSAGFFEDDRKLKVVQAEKNITLCLGVKVMSVEKNGTSIAAVIGWDVRSGLRRRFEAPLFVDATGDGAVGFLAGADYRQGRESRAETGERLAPEKGDGLQMGASCQWRAVETGKPCTFPSEPWMLKFDDKTVTAEMRGDWDWETGLNRDQVKEAEYIRDYGLLVAYSNWSFVKNGCRAKSDFATKRLAWLAYVAGKRESRRLLGDVILSSDDVLESKPYPDGTCSASWSIDLHYPKTEADTGFKGESFRSKCKQDKIVMYPIPYRCFYSRNVSNLFMAGRDISVTHAALGTVRVMRTTGMIGEVVGLAAAVCHAHACNPREVYAKYFAELKEKMSKGSGTGLEETRQTYNLHPTYGLDSGNDAKAAELRELHGMLNWMQTKHYWDRKIYGRNRRPDWDCTPLSEAGVWSAGEVTIGEIHCLSAARPKLYVGKSLAEVKANIAAGRTTDIIPGSMPNEWRTEKALIFHHYFFDGDIHDTWYRSEL